MFRILQVNKLYHPWLGGVETVAKDTAESLHGTDGIAFTNLVCQPKGKRQIDFVNGVKTYRARSWGMKSGMPLSLDFFVLFRKLVRDADILILHHPFPLAFVAYRLLGRKKKLMVWYHSDIIRQKLTKLPFLPFIRFALKASDHIFVSTNAMVSNSATLRGFSEKCRVVHFSVEISRFALTDDIKKQADDIRKQYGKPLVLCVGRLVYYKGFTYLIQAMKDVPAHLLIIGTGPLAKTLRNEIESFGLSERVRVIDPVDDLVPYYHACDVFALPSCEPSEAFGVVQIEALACGKPVVNTALTSGVPEVSVDGRTGRTVPPKDAKAMSSALRDILKDENTYARFSRNALQEVAARFSREVFGSEVLRNFRPLMEATGNPPDAPKNSG
jgi:glycosyltransferase involved in cell wall biosynthesis